MPSTTFHDVFDNVTRLLDVELNTERARSKSHEALVHAGKMAAVGRMVASVNHEIKRPLAGMRLLAESTLDLIARGDAQAAAENIGMLVRATDQLAELSRQLEGFSRKTPLNRTVIPLQQMVQQVRSVLGPKLKAGRHELRERIGVQHVLADLDRLTLAVVNLVDNAMDACADAADRGIEIDTEQVDGAIRIRVRDHGPGIDPATVDKVFEAFFTTKPPGQGLGLGLALSSEVIAEMGGRMSVRNHPAGGAEFTILLPLPH